MYQKCVCDVSNLLSSYCFFFFFKQKTAYEMRISDWSSDVCSSDLGSRNASLVVAHVAYWARCSSNAIVLTSGTEWKLSSTGSQQKKRRPLGRLIHRLNVSRSAHPCVSQGSRREVPSGGTIAVLVWFLLVAHADRDVTAGDDVVERLERVSRHFVLVVLQRVGLAYTPKLTTTVVQLRLDDGPAILVDEETALGVDVALAALERGFNLPDAV